VQHERRRRPYGGECRPQPLQPADLPRDDFPMIVEGELPTSFELPAPSLIQIIDKTRFAISTEETRYYLNGIFLHVTDDGDPMLKAAATDGHRLARVTLPRPAGAEGMPDVIVPRKCVGRAAQAA
jgi:DNA polymerase-3 subunit beta